MALNVLVICICCLNLIWIAKTVASSMNELRQWHQAVDQVKTVKMKAEASCATYYEFYFEQESFILGTKLNELENKPMNSYCGDTFAAIDDLCTYADYLITINDVQSVSCAFEKNIVVPTATLENGHLRFAFNWDTFGHKSVVKEYLISNL